MRLVCRRQFVSALRYARDCEFLAETALGRTSFIIQTKYHAGELAYYLMVKN